MVHVPSGRSANEYAPCKSLMVENVFSFCVAVTLAPGTGRPPKRTTPWCSAASNNCTSARTLATKTLILRRFRDMVDDDDFALHFLRFQPQPELLLESRKDGRATYSGCLYRIGRIRRAAWALTRLGSPLQTYVIVVLEARLVDDGSP